MLTTTLTTTTTRNRHSVDNDYWLEDSKLSLTTSLSVLGGNPSNSLSNGPSASTISTSLDQLVHGEHIALSKPLFSVLNDSLRADRLRRLLFARQALIASSCSTYETAKSLTRTSLLAVSAGLSRTFLSASAVFSSVVQENFPLPSSQVTILR